MINARCWKVTFGVFVLCAATAIAARSQTFSSLLDFNGHDGALPYYSSLAQGVDGAFYGTTESGGGSGTAFRVSPSGTLETVDFTGVSAPYGGVILASDRNFYGTTNFGGAYGYGTVFRITPMGVLTVLHSFCSQGLPCVDGREVFSGLVEGIDGNFYGTTYVGGVENDACPSGCGTIFRITSSGTLVTLYSFCGPGQGNCLDGSLPNGPLVQSRDGSFYGTTVGGGNTTQCEGGGCGTVFKITPTGSLTTLFSFGQEGVTPRAGLIQATDGNFYGTTYFGGAIPLGLGTVFRMTGRGALTTLYTFNGNVGGFYPYAPLLQATDGNLYGSTSMGGMADLGTVFEITTEGLLTTLHSFDNTDGANPESELMQGTSGRLYGTTNEGGDLSCNSPYGCGTVFSLDIGLGPFVTFVRDAGRVGHSGGILGQGFTGTTGVSLNGIPASFTVVSDTFIKATVPAGATTGYVTVTTPSGTLTSNVPFHVIP
jgi:uncharacterized repeat protein (TIGR03803 family)